MTQYSDEAANVTANAGTMSLYAAHSPNMTVSKSFGSRTSLTGRSDAKAHRSNEKKRIDSDESTPLLLQKAASFSSNSPASDTSQIDNVPTVNATLMVTIVVIVLGSSLQFGYGTGVMNNSETFIRQYFQRQGKEYTVVKWGTTVSSYGLGGLLGSYLGPKVIGAYMGRKATLLFNNLFLVMSSVLIAEAPQWYVQAVGRILVGVVAGVATAVAPTYLSELSPVEIRGAVSTSHQLGITLGILLSQLLSTPSLHMLGSIELWKWLFAVPVGCGLIQVLVLPFCPESPSYLYLTKGEHAALTALRRLLPSEVVALHYLDGIQQELQESTHAASSSSSSSSPKVGETLTVLELLRDRSLRKQLVVGVVVQLMMQFSGIDAVFYYSTTVFRSADVRDPELATTLLGVINVLVTIGAVRFMDRAGRKTLLRCSWIGMCTSYVVLTASFVLKQYVPGMDQLSVVAMTGVIVFFAFGPGCIAWFIIAEIFPVYARDTAMAIGIFINWIANWLVAFCFPILLVHTQPFTFLLFVASTAYFWYFTNRFVPETKGLSVVQVTELFRTLPLKV